MPQPLRAVAPRHGVAEYKQIETVRRRWERRQAARFLAALRQQGRALVREIRAASSPDGVEHALGRVLQQTERLLRRALEDCWQEVGSEFAGRTYRGLLAGGKRLDLGATPIRVRPIYRKAAADAAPYLGPVAASWEEEVAAELERTAGLKIGGMTASSRELLWRELRDGIAEGESIPELAARIQAAWDQAGPARATLIARTEVVAASNAGSQAGARLTGLALLKRWIATPGPRTRPAHAAAWGQQRKLDEPYLVMGQQLKYPGDTSLGASARNVCNCRCAEGYDPDPDAGDPFAATGALPAEPSGPLTAAQARAKIAEIASETAGEIRDAKYAVEHWTAELNQMARRQEWGKYDDFKPVYRKAQENLEAATANVAARMREVLYQEQGNAFKLTNKIKKGAANSVRLKALEDGVAAFRRIIGPRWMQGVEVEAVATRSGRSFANRAGKNLARINMSARAETHVVVHELGHTLEFSERTHIFDEAWKLYQQRTAGETLESLNTLYRREHGRAGGFTATEKGRRDKWFTLYMGKDYHGTQQFSGATEIISMGVELFYRDPHALALQDPDFFDWLYNLLRQ